MTSLESLRQGLVLATAGVAGLLSMGAKEQQDFPNDEPRSHQERERELLRADHDVCLMPEQEEGLAADLLRGGVYGFTNSPASDAVPLFTKRSFQSFEVHRLVDGSVHLIGYVSTAEAMDLHSEKVDLEIKLYPEPFGDSTQIVALAYRQIQPSKKGPARSDGNFLLVRVLG